MNIDKNTLMFSVAFLICGVIIGAFAMNMRNYMHHGNKMNYDHKFETRGESCEMDKMMQMHKMGQMDMADTMHNMTSGLANKTGEEFDAAFLQEMIVHHQGAVDMANQVLSKSSRPELKQLATDIIAAQNAEIAQMKAWQTSWVK